MEDLFAEGSPLEQALEGFAPREGQERMAAAIADTIEYIGRTIAVHGDAGTIDLICALLQEGARIARPLLQRAPLCLRCGRPASARAWKMLTQSPAPARQRAVSGKAVPAGKRQIG